MDDSSATGSSPLMAHPPIASPPLPSPPAHALPAAEPVRGSTGLWSCRWCASENEEGLEGCVVCLRLRQGLVPGDQPSPSADLHGRHLGSHQPISGGAASRARSPLLTAPPQEVPVPAPAPRSPALRPTPAPEPDAAALTGPPPPPAPGPAMDAGCKAILVVLGMVLGSVLGAAFGLMMDGDAGIVWGMWAGMILSFFLGLKLARQPTRDDRRDVAPSEEASGSGDRRAVTFLEDRRAGHAGRRDVTPSGRRPRTTPRRLPLLDLEAQHGTMPAARRVIEALPTHNVTAEEIASAPQEYSTCTICREEFKQGEEQRTLPCFHRFHVACVDQWLRRCGTCPNCKSRVEAGYQAEAL
eukprot:CAMPEP_0115397464 /NCGR_PEP_ID=MMETSP0271-20121206/13817_1 /TAXON_ID=71861 /ORGANISM="Scrippsiella trochoidea, Strain CCMP3099" /LENGTH=354 /DNA_ID=CAMNT_0002821211 /DNA_START=19 /DNA_END=1084 /DNA_ORIENTATION=-